MRSCKHTNTIIYRGNSIVMWARPTLAC